MAMGECSVYSSLQTDSKVKFAAWPSSWQPPGTDQLLLRTIVNSRICLRAVDHSAVYVYIILSIIIIIILIICVRFLEQYCVEKVLVV